jgi:hypothetical protein
MSEDVSQARRRRDLHVTTSRERPDPPRPMIKRNSNVAEDELPGVTPESTRHRAVSPVVETKAEDPPSEGARSKSSSTRIRPGSDRLVSRMVRDWPRGG